MRFIILIFTLPLISLSQSVVIKNLPGKINTLDAELNFVQLNDSLAYFTQIFSLEGKLESNIFTAKLINGNWAKKKYSIYNSDFFNTANIFFFENQKIFFTKCIEKTKPCKIVYKEYNSNDMFYEIPIFTKDNFLYTQPFATKHNIQAVLYFVSDREGGFGGLDIWLTIIDANGNFGVPINAGPNINTASDEVTPFYNKEDSLMYFSSNKIGGQGGFDFYAAKGLLNLWDTPINISELNSQQDDLYLTFYNKNTGYFSSNRKGAKFKDSEFCCNDIFSFQYSQHKTEKNQNTKNIHGYLPLELYFHNDEPDSRTMNTYTDKTYKEAYISFFKMKENYEMENPTLSNFFNDILQKNFNRLNQILIALLDDLSKGNNIELYIRGYASPLYNKEYNQNLSQRRISSVVNYIQQFQAGSFKTYISSKQLIIKKLPFGESNASEEISDDARDKKKSIYSIEAMLERKIEIVDVILKD